MAELKKESWKTLLDGLDMSNMDINRKQIIWKEPNEAIATTEYVDYNSMLTYKEKREKEKKVHRRNTIVIALLIVGGYFAYKKFKK